MRAGFYLLAFSLITAFSTLGSTGQLMQAVDTKATSQAGFYRARIP